ncbi:hypothetical protein [Clostridium folliculivorans]|nr:hypothetical protein [Clostridium folliculivorans]
MDVLLRKTIESIVLSLMIEEVCQFRGIDNFFIFGTVLPIASFLYNKDLSSII